MEFSNSLTIAVGTPTDSFIAYLLSMTFAVCMELFLSCSGVGSDASSGTVSEGRGLVFTAGGVEPPLTVATSRGGAELTVTAGSSVLSLLLLS